MRIELRGEHRNAAYLQLDGEPWEQKLSVDSREPTVVEITRKPRAAVMLANEGAQVLEKIRAGDAAAAAVPAAAPPAPVRAAEAGVPVEAPTAAATAPAATEQAAAPAAAAAANGTPAAEAVENAATAASESAPVTEVKAAVESAVSTVGAATS